MDAYFNGPMPNDDFFQALWQFRHDFIDRYASTVQIKDATIILEFCDEKGRAVSLRNEYGRKIISYTSPGAYRCAADFYGAQDLEPIIRTNNDRPIRDVPFSPV